MPRRSSATISRKAHAKAEADFTTWLMMAKLGGFDDLPKDAQAWLMNYRGRLERTNETEATQATIKEVYAAYYTEMGGEGEAPQPTRTEQPARAEVVDLKTARQARSSRAAGPPAPERAKRALQPFLIFAGMVAVLATLKFALGW
jgi:hypothetical protein